MASPLRRLWRLMRQPHRIPERLIEKRMNARATQFYRQRTTAENAAERLDFFAPLGNVESFVDEARQLPLVQQLTVTTSSDDPMMRIAQSQTTSLDDCLTIYTLVRFWQPLVMVETGVFYGAISAAILYAMARNGKGRLYSIDYPVESDGLDVSWRGGLVPESLRPQWELLLGDSRRELPVLLNKLGSIDAFNHDSLHTTRHMTWEFETAWRAIKPGGFLSSHDVLTTPSWKRFCERHLSEISYHGRVFGLGIAQKVSPVAVP
jgi:hypothetical protein